jgi:hypothetical protein
LYQVRPFIDPQALKAGKPGSAGPMHSKTQIAVLARGATKITVSRLRQQNHFSFFQVF